MLNILDGLKKFLNSLSSNDELFYFSRKVFVSFLVLFFNIFTRYDLININLTFKVCSAHWALNFLAKPLSYALLMESMLNLLILFFFFVFLILFTAI
tara:strand:+ start:162 stop:452 length:291 start_codon:yes stop_codon:yes gene_type:complete